MGGWHRWGSPGSGQRPSQQTHLEAKEDARTEALWSWGGGGGCMEGHPAQLPLVLALQPTGHCSPNFRAPLAALQEKTHTSRGPQGETTALGILRATPKESREAGGGAGGPQAFDALAWPGCPQVQGNRSQPPKTHTWLHLREHQSPPPPPSQSLWRGCPHLLPLSPRPWRPDPQPPHPTRTSSPYTCQTHHALPSSPSPHVTHTPQ